MELSHAVVVRCQPKLWRASPDEKGRNVSPPFTEWFQQGGIVISTFRKLDGNAWGRKLESLSYLSSTTMPNPWTGKGNPYTRREVIDRLHETIKQGDAIIAAGAGTGISAKFIEKGGGDLIIIYNPGIWEAIPWPGLTAKR